MISVFPKHIWSSELPDALACNTSNICELCTAECRVIDHSRTIACKKRIARSILKSAEQSLQGNLANIYYMSKQYAEMELLLPFLQMCLVRSERSLAWGTTHCRVYNGRRGVASGAFHRGKSLALTLHI